MNREEIIREADAWLRMNGLLSDGQTCFIMASFAQHITALVAAHEREECAKVCEDAISSYVTDSGGMRLVTLALAEAIRKRGEAKP